MTVVNLSTRRKPDGGDHATARIQRTDDLARRVAIHHEASLIADRVGELRDPQAPLILARSLARHVSEPGDPLRHELVTLIGYLTAVVERIDRDAAR